jgi:hypothetical protein
MRSRFTAHGIAGGMSDGATGKFGYARGIREAERKFFIAPEAPPAKSP